MTFLFILLFLIKSKFMAAFESLGNPASSNAESLLAVVTFKTVFLSVVPEKFEVV